MNEKYLITALKKGGRQAQKELYEAFAPKFYAVCRRYMKNEADAEDMLVQGMYRIFSNIEKFHNKGSFEGWMRRIIVNECLMSLRKNKIKHLSLEIGHVDYSDEKNIIDDLQYQELIDLFKELPNGYRTIINLYLIEGYKHREIAEMLNISINTSKSQLILAKKRVQELYKKKQQQGKVG